MVRVVVRVMIRFIVCLVSGYVHVFILLSVDTVTLLFSCGSERRWISEDDNETPDSSHVICHPFYQCTSFCVQPVAEICYY